MSTFDLFLLNETTAEHGDETEADPSVDESLPAKTLLAALDEEPFLRRSLADATRFLYHDPDTTVHFHVFVSPELIDQRSSATDEEDWEEDEPGRQRIVNPLATDEGERRSGGDEEEEDLDGSADDGSRGDFEEEMDDDDAEHEAVEFPPLSVSVPLFRPRFFLWEAVEFLDRVRQRCKLALYDPQTGGPSPADLAETWLRTHQDQARELADPSRVRTWSAESARRFYEYARARRSLLEAFASEGLSVPQLHPAQHAGELKTLCIWRCNHPSILPRSDLVLVQRPREKRGLLGRKVVLDEFVVPGERIWSLLGPFVELRTEPTTLIVYRQTNHPDQVARELEALAGDEVDSARRCELTGIVDFPL